MEQSASWSETLYCHGFSSKASADEKLPLQKGAFASVFVSSSQLQFSLRFSSCVSMCGLVTWHCHIHLLSLLLLPWLSLSQDIPLHAERPQDSSHSWSNQPATLLCETHHRESQPCISYRAPSGRECHSGNISVRFGECIRKTIRLKTCTKTESAMWEVCIAWAQPLHIPEMPDTL